MLGFTITCPGRRLPRHCTPPRKQPVDRKDAAPREKRGARLPLRLREHHPPNSATSGRYPTSRTRSPPCGRGASPVFDFDRPGPPAAPRYVPGHGVGGDPGLLRHPGHLRVELRFKLENPYLVTPGLEEAPGQPLDPPLRVGDNTRLPGERAWRRSGTTSRVVFPKLRGAEDDDEAVEDVVVQAHGFPVVEAEKHGGDCDRGQGGGSQPGQTPLCYLFSTPYYCKISSVTQQTAKG